jgi:hypothetical protein
MNGLATLPEGTRPPERSRAAFLIWIKALAAQERYKSDTRAIKATLEPQLCREVPCSAMSGYRVSFFKYLLSSDGHPFKCLQQQLDIPDVESADQAVDSAARQFEELHGLRNWKLFADSVEVACTERS